MAMAECPQGGLGRFSAVPLKEPLLPSAKRPPAGRIPAGGHFLVIRVL